MSKTLRSSGVNVLGDMPWGSHICVFYEDGDDLLDTVIPFFKTGLESNEYCLWALSGPPTMQDARHLLAFLEEHPKQAKQGFIVCRCRHPLRLHDKILAVPWFCL